MMKMMFGRLLLAPSGARPLLPSPPRSLVAQQRIITKHADTAERCPTRCPETSWTTSGLSKEISLEVVANRFLSVARSQGLPNDRVDTTGNKMRSAITSAEDHPTWVPARGGQALPASLTWLAVIEPPEEVLLPGGIALCTRNSWNWEA